MGILETRSEFNRAVWQIKETLARSERTNDNIAAAFDIALKSVRAESGAVWLYDRLGDGRITVRFAHGHTDITHLSFGLGEGIIGESVLSGAPVNIAPGDESAARLREMELGDYGGCGLMVLPLKSDLDAIGCIHAVSREGSAFGDKDFDLMDMFSLLAAMEIEKSGMLVSRKPHEQLIRLRGVTKTYGTAAAQVRALRGVNLSVNEGEFLVILGKSGCGKTTLLNIIGGMDSFDEGEYQFRGEPIKIASDKALTQFRRDNVGFIFQQYSLMQDLTARENLLLIAGIAKSPASADEALRLVGLSERANNYPSQLSGGEQQRVAIARALIKSPKLVLADEPTAALDEATSTQVLDIFDNLVRKTGITLVMITHNPEIAKMADRVAKMREGRLSEITVNPHPLKATELTW